jgi:hypothetical protein
MEYKKIRVSKVCNFLIVETWILFKKKIAELLYDTLFLQCCDVFLKK